MPLSNENRVAIAELVKAAELLSESVLAKPNDQVAALGAILLQRAAKIARGDTTHYVYDQGDVEHFLEWINGKA